MLACCRRTRLQARRKDSEKLPDFQKVDCVSVSFAPFKAAVEDQLQRLSDALVVSLRAALVGNLKTVERCVLCARYVMGLAK